MEGGTHHASSHAAAHNRNRGLANTTERLHRTGRVAPRAAAAATGAALPGRRRRGGLGCALLCSIRRRQRCTLARRRRTRHRVWQRPAQRALAALVDGEVDDRAGGLACQRRTEAAQQAARAFGCKQVAQAGAGRRVRRPRHLHAHLRGGGE
eukprot:365402-Chlamydomonas_euryale.AAC.7